MAFRKGIDKAQRQDGVYFFPFWPLNEKGELLYGWTETAESDQQKGNWLTIADEKGKPIPFGEQVIDAYLLCPNRRMGDLPAFLRVDLQPVDEKENKNYLKISAVPEPAIVDRRARYLDSSGPAVKFGVVVKYRSK